MSETTEPAPPEAEITAPAPPPRPQPGQHPIVLWHWGRKGAGPEITLWLAEALAAAGHAVLPAIAAQSEMAEATLARFPATLVQPTYDSLQGAMLATIQLPLVRWRFLNTLKRLRPRAVISTMTHPWSPALAFGVAARAGRFLSILHDADPHPGAVSFGRSTWQGRELAAADGVICLSQHVARRAAERYFLTPDRTAMLALPGTLYPPRPKVPAAPMTPLRLAMLGRLEPYKGLGLLADALKQVTAPIVVTIAGSGSDPALVRLAADPRVRIVNRWLTDDDFSRLLAETDLLLAPYIEASQSGIVPSALLAGVPVAATPVGGLPEQVRPGVSGLIASAATPVAFAAIVQRLAEDRALLAQLSRTAADDARQRLSWPGFATGVLDFLARVEGLKRRR